VSQYHFLSSFVPYIVIGIVLASLAVMIIVRSGKKKIMPKEIFREGILSLGMTLSTFLLGLVLALVLTTLIAVLQLNVISISLRINSQSAGVITDKQQLINKLKSMDKAPEIIPYTTNEQGKLLITLTNSSPTDNSFYTKSLIQNIPAFLTFPLQVPDKSVFMIKNVLVVKSINPPDIEPLSPYIGYLLVKSYFNGRFIKSYPSVKVMGRQEYLDYRTSQFDSVISKLNSYILSIDDEISGYYGRIQDDKNKIASWESYISTANSNKSAAYNNCISAGYYDFFTYSFMYTNSQSYCQSVASQYDNYVNQGNQSIASLNQDINATSYNISQDQDAETTAKGYISSLENAKTQTPQELGIFEADNNIKVAVDETSPNVVVDYFETLSHEYLHYASYVNKDSTLKYSFFEEGLTETFARQVAKKEFGVDTHMGYPVLVAIMSEMMKKIQEKTLEDIYFTKDETTLEAVLANAYGEKFYNDFGNYFDILGYLPARDTLSMANAILLRMGAKTINASDLYSTPDTSN